MNYFENVKTMAELKSRYRDLAKQFHPDKNPNGLKAMQDINNQYEILFDKLNNGETIETARDYIEIIERLLKYENIEIEIIGTWIWVHGETRPIKEELKSLGFRWASKKKKWYLGEHKAKGKYKQRSLDDIRETYGSQFVTKTQKATAAIA